MSAEVDTTVYGKILLSTVMEDELLDELMPKDYVRMINEIRPDATMTTDSYTYLDDPLCLSWEQTLKQATFSSAFSELDIPVVGLIKGAIWKQIAWSAESAIELGCESFALPSRELAELGVDILTTTKDGKTLILDVEYTKDDFPSAKSRMAKKFARNKADLGMIFLKGKYYVFINSATDYEPLANIAKDIERAGSRNIREDE